jgi:hypothetical protein
MMETLECEVAEDTKENDFEDMFDFICGLKNGAYCDGINKNATSGPYGVYGMCSNREQLSFAANTYAKKAKGAECDFDGKASSKKAVATPSASGCSALLKDAGVDGTGSVSAAAAATGTSSGGKGGASGSAGAAAGLSAPHFTNGAFGVGLYVVGAVASGMAMILL